MIILFIFANLLKYFLLIKFIINNNWWVIKIHYISYNIIKINILPAKIF